MEFYKGEDMNQKEWKKYFEEINHRSPSPDEVKDAIKRGEVKRSIGKMFLGALLLAVTVIIVVAFFSMRQEKTASNSNAASLEDTSSSIFEARASVSSQSDLVEDIQAQVDEQVSQVEAFKAKSTMDISAMKSGDFSSVAGLWKTSSKEISIDASGRLSVGSLSTSVKFVQEMNGGCQFRGNDGTPLGMASFVFYPETEATTEKLVYSPPAVVATTDEYVRDSSASNALHEAEVKLAELESELEIEKALLEDYQESLTELEK